MKALSTLRFEPLSLRLHLPRFGDWPVRWKLLALVGLSSFFSLTLAAVAVIVSDLVWYHRAVVNSLKAQAETLAAVSGAVLARADAQAARQVLEALRPRLNTRCAAFYGPDGRVFATYERHGDSACRIPPAEAEGTRMDGGDLLVFRDVEHEGRRVGSLVLRQALNRMDRVVSSTGIAAAVLAGALLLGLLVSARMQRVITRPLFDIVAVARGVTERRDYSLRAQKSGRDEVGLLTDAFNQMLAQIERTSAELKSANAQLQLEIGEHRQAREQVQALNALLELRVARRTRDLELANRELESFSYSVSHDLRAPLRAIEGFSAALLDHQAQLDDAGRGHLQRVCAASRRMGLLIDGLLNLARTTRTELCGRELDLSGMAHRVVRELLAVHPTWAVQFDIAPGLRAQGDPVLVRTVLDNLLGNAAKFSAGKPDARVVFSAQQQEGQTVFVVQDNGVGFDMAHAARLFGAFQRLHPQGEFEGTGIGLANVQRIIQRHGGRIWAEGRRGQGASFYFTLPG
ncbi:MAG TPA: ATP-binding protein [Burkholderiaceae bacterium]|nr:ATP-binding protein [Burkholderiaceae bacterium]